jgi:hypothetical protein
MYAVGCDACDTIWEVRWLDEIQRFLAELPPGGGRRLFELWKQISERRTGQSGERSPLELLRYLLLRLSEHWEGNRVFDWRKDVPWTKNAPSR